MIDINAPDFLASFDLSKATVGLVGHGYVNKAVEAYFTSQKNKCNVRICDKDHPELGSLEDLVKEAELIFVAVPTPMRKDGSCYTGIVEKVVREIRNEAERQGRPTDSFIVILKSTVPPGFTAGLQKKNPDMRILFSPEFLTEKNSIADFVGTNRMIFGGDEEDALVACKYVAHVFPQKVMDNRLLLMRTEPTAAEMVKLFTNGILMTKVLFSNEIFQICKKLEVPFEEVRKLACLDRRIGASHTMVPGPDGHLGAGGHCFPKDIHSLQFVAKELGVQEKLITAVVERNEELREDKDWLQMKERAVTDA
ncbi:MAG: Rossmann-fold NAD(P)-binding domain-containing protein [Acidiferrobacterales bacterium]